VAESVTAKEVALRAEVSVGTVSRVFNNYSNVSHEIRQRVLRVATDLGYQGPHRQSANTQSSTRLLKIMGFLYACHIDEGPATTDPYWDPIFHGVERECRRSNVQFVYRTVTDIRHNPQRLTELMYEMRLDGALLVGQFDSEAIRAIQASGTPVVQVDNYIPDLANSIDTILADNFQGARLAIDYLIGQGHRHIAFIAGPNGTETPPVYIHATQQRWVSYCMAFIERNWPIDHSLIEKSNLTMEGGYRACLRLLECGADFTALFCVDDITAIGAMKALREAGRDVPGDISVIGFDGIELGELITPALTTIRVNAPDLGAIAFKTLVSRVTNPSLPCVTVQLGVQLVQRASVAAISSSRPPRGL